MVFCIRKLTLAALALAGPASALYTKSGGVLLVDSKNFQKEILESDYAGVVEFFAPWCGHCKNLVPNYEKVAKNLKGLAKVAAIDCDDDKNKQLCGQYGVQGFPTLKTFRPTAKKGKPLFEDYNGQRTAKAIVDAVIDKIPNHVQKVTDANINEFLSNRNATAKAVLFTQKGTTSPLYRALAIDFRGRCEFGQIRDKEEQAVKLFGIGKFPTLVLLPGGKAPGVVYDGEMKKDPLTEFFNLLTPLHEGKYKQAEPDEMPPPPPPNQQRIMLYIPDLIDEAAITDNCFGNVPGICVLAFVDQPTSDPQKDPKLQGLLGANEKIASTSRNIRFYKVQNHTPHAQQLMSKLGLKKVHPSIIAVNAGKKWWKPFTGESPDMAALLDWLDGLKLGDIKKDKLPKELFPEKVKEEKVEKEEVKVEEEKKVEEDKEKAEEKVEEKGEEKVEEVEDAKKDRHEEL